MLGDGENEKEEVKEKTKEGVRKEGKEETVGGRDGRKKCSGQGIFYGLCK